MPELGIEIVAVRLSAAGNLVDLRYRVVDIDRARLVLASSMHARIVDRRTGSAGSVPMDEKLGPLSQNGNRVRAGQVLAVLFGNPNRALKKGDTVTIMLGGWEVDGLSIQG